MNEADAFPWKPALTGAALLALALLTVSIRAGVVAEGHALLRLEHHRAALKRHERALQIRLQEQWQQIGRQDLAAGRSGGSRS
jgi:hypothetical protein